MSMKDAAILTKYYKNYNYGGMLQGYALHKVIKDLGYSVDIVSYDVNANPNPVYPGLRQQIKQYGAGAAVEKAGEKAIGKCRFLISGLLKDRARLFDQFMEDTGAGTELYDDAGSAALRGEYKAFVSGSDQIWNPNAVRNLYLQTFIEDPRRKISYAASIGRDAFSEHEADILIPAISGFGAISVREKDSRAVRKRARAFCVRHGLRMIMIPYAKQEYNLTDAAGPGERIAKTGPREFVSLIRGAEFVLTDSFHGAVFSLIYKKPFVVFERNKSGHVSMNSRLYDLLALFEQSHRLMREKARALTYLKNSIETAIAAADETAAK